MVELNLPKYPCKLKKAEGKVWIFDIIRKKFVVLTPEEWVRQHFLNYLLEHMNYPRSLVKIESGLKFNTLLKRSDIVIYNQHAQPWMLIECKRPDQKITSATVHQAATYNHTLQCRYLTITNGLQHFCVEIDDDNTFKQLDQLPDYTRTN